MAVAFDEPQWISQGYLYEPLPVYERVVTETKRLDEGGLAQVVHQAHKIPEFSPAESNRIEIVLHRLLHGCGAPQGESGLLDFCIALESALLGDIRNRTELSYRFALYGALFLRDNLDPARTFDRLRNIYGVRSKLVHGSSIKPTERREAEIDAKQLAIAVVRNAVEAGWPSQAVLDKLAIGPLLSPDIRKA